MVNNCLADIPFGKFVLHANERVGQGASSGVPHPATRAASGHAARSCSAARRLFFESDVVTLEEAPHRAAALRAAEQERADVVRARQRWMREQGMFDPAHLVF